MPKTIALLTLHGMGHQQPDYGAEFISLLRDEVGEALWSQVSLQPVYYQDLLQKNEAAVWTRVEPLVRWRKARKFVLYGFSDAASLEHHQNAPASPYLQTQERICGALDRAYKEAGETEVPVVLVAHSLGCQVISSFIWDAQRESAFAGCWRDGGPTDVAKGSAHDRFRRLKTVRRLFTTGCNIPVFISGHDRIEPFKAPNPEFEWVNLYDKDDVLGWPLGPLCPSYATLVRDIPVSVGRGVLDRLFKSWNPISHTLYWTDPAIVKRIGDSIRQLA